MPETVPIPELPKQELLDALRARGFPIGVDTHLAVSRLVERLGPDVARERLRIHLRPLLASSKEQALEFDEIYRTFLTPEEQPPPPAPIVVQVVENKPSWWRYGAAASLLMILLAVAAWIAMILRPVPPPPMPAPPPRIDPVQTPDKVLRDFKIIPRSIPKPESAPPPAWVSFHEAYRWPLWLGALALPLLLRLAWMIYRKRTERLVAGSWKSHKKPYRWPVELPEKAPVWPAAGVRETSTRMSIRERSGQLELDLPATVAATARSAGMPDLRHRESRRAPEYLVLIERRGPRDHLATLFESLTGRLTQSGVPAEVWFFRDEPVVCQAQKGGKAATIEALQARYPQHRLLIFADALAVLDRYTAQLTPLSAVLTRWSSRAVLTALPPGPAETRSLDAAFVHAPATLEGLRAMVDRFDLSLPDARRTRQWPTASRAPQGIDELRRYLGDGFPWLCACALYPELHYDLTLRLGARARVNPGGFREDHLLRLLSLDWFRVGVIPDEMRERLYGELGAREREAREEIAAVLQRMAPPEGSVAAQRRALQIELHRDWPEWDRKLWERVPEQEITRDPVVVLTLRPAAEREWMALPAWLRDQLYHRGIPLLGWRRSAGAVAAVAAAAVLLPALLYWEWRVADWNAGRQRVEPPLYSAAAPPLELANSTFSSGLGRFRFGMAPEQVNKLLPRPFANAAWDSLPFAPEYAGSDVRYFFVPLAGFPAGDRDLALLRAWAPCWGGQGYVAFLFLKTGLFRISSRLFADCQQKDVLLREAARQAGVAEFNGKAPVVFVARGRDSSAAGYSAPAMTSLEIYRNDMPEPALSWVGGGLLTSVNKRDGLTYVWIPPGKFVMGCSPGDRECLDDEGPAHEVRISRGFWMGQTEVTQAAWRRVMKSSPSQFKGDQLPLENVNWDEARQYCAKIGARLPTEAEWEYAARGGTTGARYGESDAVAWHGSNSGSTTHPVGGKTANPFGLYDMLGNVFEWVADWYGAYSQAAVIDPKGPGSGPGRILRGGSWNYIPRGVRVSVRDGGVPSLRNNFTGVRCAGEFR